MGSALLGDPCASWRCSNAIGTCPYSSRRINFKDCLLLELTMPLRSCLVVKSAARFGGFWFHPASGGGSSVREGQFMVNQKLQTLASLYESSRKYALSLNRLHDETRRDVEKAALGGGYVKDLRRCHRPLATSRIPDNTRSFPFRKVQGPEKDRSPSETKTTLQIKQRTS